MIHLLKEKATPVQAQEMLERYENMIKIVVDIRHRFLAGGGEMHAVVSLSCWMMVANRMIYGVQTGIRTSNGLNLNL